MNKTKKATQETKESKEIFNFAELDFNKVEDIVKRKQEEKYRKDQLVTRYPLCGGVTLSIYDTDKDYDYGTLNIYGVSINVTFRGGKNGMFCSYPSVKTSKGEYSQMVNNFSKAFNSVIKEVLEKHYEE